MVRSIRSMNRANHSQGHVSLLKTKVRALPVERLKEFGAAVFNFLLKSGMRSPG